MYDVYPIYPSTKLSPPRPGLVRKIWRRKINYLLSSRLGILEHKAGKMDRVSAKGLVQSRRVLTHSVRYFKFHAVRFEALACFFTCI